MKTVHDANKKQAAEDLAREKEIQEELEGMSGASGDEEEDDLLDEKDAEDEDIS